MPPRFRSSSERVTMSNTRHNKYTRQLLFSFCFCCCASNDLQAHAYLKQQQRKSYRMFRAFCWTVRNFLLSASALCLGQRCGTLVTWRAPCGTHIECVVCSETYKLCANACQVWHMWHMYNLCANACCVDACKNLCCNACKMCGDTFSSVRWHRHTPFSGWCISQTITQNRWLCKWCYCIDTASCHVVYTPRLSCCL